MRNIDQDIACAIKYHEDLKKGGVIVKQVCHNLCIIKYYGAVIGRVEYTEPKPYVFVTLNGYSTKSTRARVNAILSVFDGGQVYCKNGRIKFEPNPLATAIVSFDDNRSILE